MRTSWSRQGFLFLFLSRSSSSLLSPLSLALASFTFLLPWAFWLIFVALFVESGAQSQTSQEVKEVAVDVSTPQLSGSASQCSARTTEWLLYFFKWSWDLERASAVCHITASLLPIGTSHFLPQLSQLSTVLSATTAGTPWQGLHDVPPHCSYPGQGCQWLNVKDTDVPPGDVICHQCQHPHCWHLRL